MKRMCKAAAFAALALAIATFFAGCTAEPTPYETNNDKGYTVSVKYDANGGIFTTNTSVIVDSFNASTAPQGADGKTAIALLSPDNAARGNDAFRAVNNGYFLAGWYQERFESTDEDGNTAYTYSGKWDFESDRLQVDPNGTYSSEQPVMTLYAAWVPLFEVAFYDRATGELVESFTYDPTTAEELQMPAWDTETGAVEMYDFPEREGYTFDKAYLDAEGKNAITTETITHTGAVNYETGTAKDSTMKLYVDYTEGEWYRIYTAEQFGDNASVNGCYEIMADLDFADEIWPTSLMYGNFTGIIHGNGHTIKNVTLEQTNNSKINAGLFGNLTETAVIEDLKLDNICFTMKAGTRMVDASFGLFAGKIATDATVKNVAITNSTLQIDSSCYFGVDEYSIGLVCGGGNAAVVSPAQITCKVVGDDPDAFKVTVNGNDVTIGD